MVDLRLVQKLELRQVLTPKLIETLKLLILPKLELVERLDQELMENPMLEVEEDDPQISGNTDENIAEWRKFLDGIRLTSTQLGERDPNIENADPLVFTTYEKTVYESLSDQLAVAVESDRARRIGDFIIGNLDDRGFLAMSVEEIAGELTGKGELEPPASIEEIKKVLKTVQSLSPPGIAARDIRECLMLQLEDLALENTLAYEIVNKHYAELLNRNVPQLVEILDATEQEVEHAKEILSHLTLYPAEGRGTLAISIEPDLVIFRDKNGDWTVAYNNENIPELRINKRYQQLLKKADNFNEKTKAFLLKKLESAKWWIDALNQRRKTLIGTMEAIIEFQFDFFEKGPEFIKPLKMETVADVVGVHPATISRVVRDKFVLTPYGTFALRGYFTGGLESTSGEDIATNRVKQRIQEIVNEENKHKPLSDEKISQIIQHEGIKIARRTVAKYRQQLSILSARMRKR